MTNQGTWTGLVRTATKRPPRLVLYAPSGVGKSTLGSRLPKPLVIDFDDGLTGIDVPAITGPRTWMGVRELVETVATSPGDRRSLVIDTIDPLEELATEYVCKAAKKDSLSAFGYGAGYEALAGEWRLLLAALDKVRDAGLTVLLLAHSVPKTVMDPSLGEYTMNTPMLQKKTWAATLRWADCVFYAAFDAARVGEEKRAIVTGERVLHTTTGSGFTAKNRYSLPARLPLSWAAIDAAINAPRETPAQIRETILALAGTEYQAKAMEYMAEAGDDVGLLLSIESALKERIGS